MSITSWTMQSTTGDINQSNIWVHYVNPQTAKALSADDAS